MCCVEGDGLYDLKLDGVVIIEGGDFGKSEKIWFDFQNCIGDVDCNNGDFSMNFICRNEAAACAHFPEACHEHGHIANVNATACNCPESATWLIKDKEGYTHLEGGPCEMLKRLFVSDAHLPDGMHDLISTGSDLIGSTTEMHNDRIAINEECLQLGEVKTFAVGHSSVNPTPQLTPSAAPTVGFSPISPDFCQEFENKLLIEFMSDVDSEWDNKLFAESNHELAWVEILRMQNFRSSNLNTFSVCLSETTHHRLKIIDEKANYICCENGQGWHDIHWNGKCSFCYFRYYQ